jgi:F0F1-type ATP synthase assembly protein I
MNGNESQHQFRPIENLHIVFWLIKDASWAANFKLGGMAMILPTLLVAIFLTIKQWHSITERFHNLAVSCWILANSIWMTGEFFAWDEAPYHFRKLALVPFSIGLLLIAIYYIFLHRKIRQTPTAL